MDEDFTSAVQEGLRLSKRVHTGKPPMRAADSFMDRSSPAASRFLPTAPTAPTAYALISDPAIVDNPDIPSYQPHVHGSCDPPALIPLQMMEIALEVECYLGMALVTVRGRWRVHCVMGNKSCDCRVVIPMAEQGSILGVEADLKTRSYSSQLIQIDEHREEEIMKTEDGGFLKPNYFFCTMPMVSGGSEIYLKVRWSQKLSYKAGQLSITIPFNFPEYVTPFVKISPKWERIQLTINSGTEMEVLCQNTSHPLKEKACQVGKLWFLYEADVDYWSCRDFYCSFTIYSGDLCGGVLVQSPSMHEFDQREMFCLYLFPGRNQRKNSTFELFVEGKKSLLPERRSSHEALSELFPWNFYYLCKVFRKEVVFVVDVSGSMQGKPLESVKNALAINLSKLTPGDYFDIIAFNEEMHLFSSSLEPATSDMVESAKKWIRKTFIAEGGTNITQLLFAQPLKKAMSLLSNPQDSLPHIFFITDGSVEDERIIYNTMRNHVEEGSHPMSPRISTFGIGSFCNHYFLQLLASVGRGQYGAAYDPDSIEVQMLRWLDGASSPIFTNITVDVSDHLNAFEMYSLHIPDLSVGGPLMLLGRYQGKLPHSLKVKGVFADMTDIAIDLKVQKTKDIPLERIFAKQQIDLLTAQAWFSESKDLQEKVVRLSLQYGFPSEYTYLVLRQTHSEVQDFVPEKSKKANLKASQDVYLSCGMRLGFGNTVATAENHPAGFDKPKPQKTFAVYKAAGCCSWLCDCCCCMCCLQTWSKINDQCTIITAQLCGALSCFGCFECCTEVCCDG